VRVCVTGMLGFTAEDRRKASMSPERPSERARMASIAPGAVGLDLVAVRELLVAYLVTASSDRAGRERLALQLCTLIRLSPHEVGAVSTQIKKDSSLFGLLFG
jgi:hypothetical protein